MNFQAWLKSQNSATHFTTDLLQMHHDSHSWVHWAQQKFEEDQSCTCSVFREGLSMYSPCQGQGAMQNCQPGMSMRMDRPGPIPPARQGSRQAGGQPEHPSAPLPDVVLVTHQVWGPAGKFASLKVWLNRIHSQAEMGQSWGQGHLQLRWGQSQRLSWNGVHLNAFHSAKSCS